MLIFGSTMVTAVALGGMGLVALKMWLRRSGGLDREELAEVVREVVRKELDGRDEQIEDLHERLDFTERLLQDSNARRHDRT